MSEPDSRLYDLFSRAHIVGRGKKAKGETGGARVITFSDIDVNEALEHLVEDGDNFLLETMYPFMYPRNKDSLDYRVIESTLTANLINRASVPDTKEWTSEQESYFQSYSQIEFSELKGLSSYRCYNTENDRVETFDPSDFGLSPVFFNVKQDLLNYRTVYNFVRKLKSKGYDLASLSMSVSGESRSVKYDYPFSLEFSDGKGLLKIKDLTASKLLISHLIPGIKGMKRA
jgi:hypothetical protein